MLYSIKGFTDLNHPICYKEGSRMVMNKSKDLNILLNAYEEELFELWNRSISGRISQSLNRPLVLRDAARGTIKVNLSREIVSMLRDVSKFTIAIYFCYYPINGTESLLIYIYCDCKLKRERCRIFLGTLHYLEVCKKGNPSYCQRIV